MKSLPLWLSGTLATLALAAGLPAVAVDQTTDKRGADAARPSTAGRDLFEFYCASCHGRDGKGGGHAAPALKVAPPDLTTLAARNHGVFPGSQVRELIAGTRDRLSTPAHGSREMPVWGPIFKALDDRDEVNASRLESLVRHLESMQAKAKA